MAGTRENPYIPTEYRERLEALEAERRPAVLKQVRTAVWQVIGMMEFTPTEAMPLIDLLRSRIRLKEPTDGGE